ncbi:SET domain-containing protein [Hirschfeldia incana]|nr:SET domain-containing protein [Hirschfeldia incana]
MRVGDYRSYHFFFGLLHPNLPEMETISAEDVGNGVDLSPPLSPLTFSLYDSFLSSHCSSCFSLLPPTPPHSLYCSSACSSLITDDSPTVFPPDLSPILSAPDIRAALRLLISISSSSSAVSAYLPHRLGGLLTNHHRLMADPSFSVAIQRAAGFISSVMRSDRRNTVLEEAAICSVLTNAVEVQDSRTGVALGIAVYDSRFSWINHSCSPNACYRFLISPPHTTTTTTSSFQKTLPRITDVDEEHFSSITSTYEGKLRYGPKVIVRSIKRIKSGEEITVSYIDLLQPTGLRQSDLWSKYRFICNCGRCAASPPAHVDSILEGVVVALEHEIITVDHHDDGAATVGKMTNHIQEAIDDFLSDDIDPATCCEKIEGVLHRGILDSSSLRLHPSHHVALHAYITLASAYRIRSIDSETDLGRAFEMSRIGAAYSLFLAGVSHHLVFADLSFAISAANFWTRAGESLLELACKFLMESSGEYDDVKCSKCLMLVENHRDIKENINQILKCAVTDSDSSQVTWSFLTRGCPYLQKFKSSIDFSFTGTNCKREESSVD